jgi:hypothetical protein
MTFAFEAAVTRAAQARIELEAYIRALALRRDCALVLEQRAARDQARRENEEFIETLLAAGQGRKKK